MAHISFYACASIFRKFFIFLLHFRYDNYNLFRKCITLKYRDLYLKQKQKWFFYTDKFSRSTDRILQSVSKVLTTTLVCKRCWKFYIGETKNLKPRTRKHISDIKHPKNSYCRTLAEHLRKCSPRAPQFKIFPIFYVEDRKTQIYRKTIDFAF